MWSSSESPETEVVTGTSLPTASTAIGAETVARVWPSLMTWAAPASESWRLAPAGRVKDISSCSGLWGERS